MLQLAGEVADGVILNSLVTPAHIQHAKALMQQGAARAGRDPSALTIAASVIYAVADDAEEAAAAAKEDVLFYLGYQEINPILEHAGVMEEADAIRRAPQLITQRMLDHLATYVTAERFRTRLRAVIEAGLDVPIIRVSNVPYAETEKKSVLLRAIESLRDF